MNVTQFRRTREARWRQLEQLTKGRHPFSDESTLRTFLRLYRQTSSDLAYARTYYPEHSVTLYLNNLVTTAYPRIYRFKKGGQQNLVHFLTTGFPTLFRELFRYILLAGLITFAGALYGFVLVHYSPQAAYHLLPNSLVRQIQPNQTGPHKVLAPIISTAIMTHNMLVAFEAFVGGITLGLFTLYALWQNGLMIGVLAAMFQTQHKSVVFWSLIVPHGVTELTAIFIAGGAGLVFAHHMMAPGQMSRMRALRFGGAKAVQLVLGTIPMLMIAGTIEGFLTPSFVPDWVKFGTAVITGIGWVAYFGFVGRRFAHVSGLAATALEDTPQRHQQLHPPAVTRRY